MNEKDFTDNEKEIKDLTCKIDEDTLSDLDNKNLLLNCNEIFITNSNKKKVSQNTKQTKLESICKSHSVSLKSKYYKIDDFVELHCLECRNNWKITAHTVFRKRWFGCPECERKRKAYERFKALLDEQHISLKTKIVDYQDRQSYVKLYCKICKFIWIERLNNVRSKAKSGKICSKCSNTKIYWNYFDIDVEGNKISNEKQYRRVVKYFKKIIIPTLISRDIIIEGQTPKLEHLLRKEGEYQGFQNFYRAIASRGINYLDLLSIAGYEKFGSTWRFFDYNSENELRSDKEQISVIVSYFLNEIIISLEEEGIISENETPKIKHISYDFLHAVFNRGFTYNELLKHSGYEINLDKNRWAFLIFDECGVKFNRKDKIKAFSHYFLTIIIPDLLKRNKIFEGEVPSAYVLEKNGYGGFRNAFRGEPKIVHNELIKESGFTPRDIKLSLILGIFFHYIAGRYFIEFTRSHGCYSYYGVFPNINASIYNRNYTDNTIIVDEAFSKLSQKALETYQKGCKLVHIDYFLGLRRDIVIDHCSRGYQDEEELLILVPLDADKTHFIPDEVPLNENVLILDFSSYLDFFGFDDEFIENFYEALDLVFECLEDSELKTEFNELAEDSRLLLNDSLHFSHNNFQKALKKLGWEKLLFYNY